METNPYRITKAFWKYILNISEYFDRHSIKYAQIRIFSDLYIGGYYPYTGIYRSFKDLILAYFTQWELFFKKCR